jgi:hypothetical protein
MSMTRLVPCSHFCSQLVTTASELKRRDLRRKLGFRTRGDVRYFTLSLLPTTMTTPRIVSKPLTIQGLGCSQWMTTRVTTFFSQTPAWMN